MKARTSAPFAPAYLFNRLTSKLLEHDNLVSAVEVGLTLRYTKLANSTIFFDGMTIQQVGEVVSGADCTAAIRPICVESYIRALQEFAFAIVFGGRFGTNRDLPNVGKDRPGADLIEDSALQGLVDPLPTSLGNPQLRDLLSIDSFKQSVSEDVARFPADTAGVFSEWLMREMCAYPLEDYAPIGPDQISFGSRTYLTMPDIEQLLPLGRQERLVSCLRRHVKRDGQEPLLRRFVQVNAFNLVGISRMYEQGVNSIQRSEPFFRIPHPTRAQILLQMRRDYDKEKLFGTLRAFALACSLQNISSRQEFLSGLVACRRSEPRGSWAPTGRSEALYEWPTVQPKRRHFPQRRTKALT